MVSAFLYARLWQAEMMRNWEKNPTYFTVKSLTQWALICISAEIHHLTTSQISPTHSLSLLFTLGWVSLGQNFKGKKNKLKGASCKGFIKWWNGKSEEKAVAGIRFFHMIPEYMSWIPKGPWANLMSFHDATPRYSFKRQRLKTQCKDYQGLSKKHRQVLHTLTATLTWEGW